MRAIARRGNLTSVRGRRWTGDSGEFRAKLKPAPARTTALLKSKFAEELQRVIVRLRLLDRVPRGFLRLGLDAAAIEVPAPLGPLGRLELEAGQLREDVEGNGRGEPPLLVVGWDSLVGPGADVSTSIRSATAGETRPRPIPRSS